MVKGTFHDHSVIICNWKTRQIVKLLKGIQVNSSLTCIYIMQFQRTFLKSPKHTYQVNIPRFMSCVYFILCLNHNMFL